VGKTVFLGKGGVLRCHDLKGRKNRIWREVRAEDYSFSKGGGKESCQKSNVFTSRISKTGGKNGYFTARKTRR